MIEIVKKVCFILSLFVLFGLSLNAQQETLQAKQFYYYKGEKQYLELDTRFIFVSVADEKAADIFFANNLTRQPLRVDITNKMQSETGYKRFWTKLSLEDNLSEETYMAKLSEINNSGKDIIAAPYFKNKHQDNIGLSNFFSVKLKSLSDTLLLKWEAEKEHAVIVHQNQFMPLWFVLSVTVNSKYNAMEMANRFYESGLFQYAKPNLMVSVQLACANDSLFQQQWALKKTVQHKDTFGINACDAWQIATGAGVVVAVFDTGIHLDHPDLAANKHPLSYDCAPNVPDDGDGSHGTCCAGIIGAVRNNEKGIAGVAPDCKLMSVRHPIDGDPFIEGTVANGINWAWQNGADVISNSWGTMHPDEEMDDAITAAATLGRGGKGCVVVAGAGNGGHTGVAYPARHPDAFAVGAMNRNGQRWTYSCYGNDLDVVAPGKDVWTTTSLSNGYSYTTFNATSCACPHVSGIAALILSVNSTLTAKKVRYIIESTAQKLHANSIYTYSATPGRPNGGWNFQMGYGLVDAYAAVQWAAEYMQDVYIQNETISTDRHIRGKNIYVGRAVTNTKPQGDVTITNNARVIFDATGNVIFDGGLGCSSGGSFEIRQ